MGRYELEAKLRGIVGLGLIGGVAGFLTGALWGITSSLVRSGIFFDAEYLRFLGRMALGNATGFMLIGASTGAGFATLLAAFDPSRSIDDLPLWRMGLFGALVGAAFPPLYVIAAMGLPGYLASAPTLLPVMGVLAGVGAVFTTSVVAIAKRANRSELSADDTRKPLPDAR